MLTRTHFVIAVLLLLLFSNNFLFVVGFLVATIFVDIDAKKSRIGNHWYLRPVQWLTSHRGVFHSLFFAIVLSSIIYFFNSSLGAGFFFGYLLHLGLDCLTTRGCRLFWPLDFKISFFLRSGGLIEEVIFVLVLLLDLFLGYRLLNINV